MAAVILSGGTVYLGDAEGGWTEIGSLVSADLTLEPVADEPFAPFEPFSMTRSVSLSYKLSTISAPLFRALFDRRHPRLRSMHCAYSRRLKARRRADR